MFQYSLEQSGEVGIVRVKEAKLTYPVLSPFFNAVRRIVEGGARKLVIDLGAVAYMDSVAIGCLIDIHRLLEHRQGAVSGTPGKPPAYAGTDFIVARNGRIASVYLFFDNLP
jgi:hypothetical protein